MLHHLAPFAVAVAAAAAPPTAAPVPVPAPSSSPSPAASAAPSQTYVRFADVELLLAPRTANALSPNLTGPTTNSLRGAIEYRFLGKNFAELEYRRWRVVHPAGFVTQPATLAQSFVPARRFTEQDLFFNSSIYGIGHSYIASSTIIHSNDEGTPTLHSDFGIGFEQLPNPRRAASLFGSYFYYPEVSGKLSLAGGARPKERFKLQTFRLGGALAIPQTHAFLSAALVADHYLRKENAPGDATHTALSLGIGYSF